MDWTNITCWVVTEVSNKEARLPIDRGGGKSPTMGFPMREKFGFEYEFMFHGGRHPPKLG